MGDLGKLQADYELFERFADELDRPEQRWVCDGCDRWGGMEVWIDRRAVKKEKVDGVLFSFQGIGPNPDPPRHPTIYRCPECGHEHEGPPALKRPT